MQVRLVNLAKCESLRDREDKINNALDELGDKWINHVYIQETEHMDVAVIIYSERKERAP
jgi:hypothetical protein